MTVENLKGLVLQPDTDSTLTQLACAQIDFERSKSLDGGRTSLQRQHRIEKFTSPPPRPRHFTQM